jgi:general secretion pathway protein G
MFAQFHRASAFTLMEILIVVVIVGILAAIVIPQFNDLTDESRVTSTRTVLYTIREQLEVYKAHHNEEYPTLAEMWDNLLGPTDADGTLSVAGRYGPYLTSPPYNPFTQSTTIVATGTGTASDGWEYDENTGQFTAVGFDETTGIFTAP